MLLAPLLSSVVRFLLSRAVFKIEVFNALRT
jgi:hypothetical protein